MTQPTRDEFYRHIHRALRHLYEPVELHLSPLAELLGVNQPSARGDVPSRLRQSLLDAIHSLKPGPRAPLDNNAWRVYQVLCYRFEEQAEQEEVASQMALSARQVRRLEQTAIQALAEVLITRYGVEINAGESKPEPTPDQTGPEQELDWLRQSYPLESASVSELVETALKTCQPMLENSGSRVSHLIPDGLPYALGQMTTLRQVLLNLLLAALRAAPGGEIRLEVSFQPPNEDSAPPEIHIEISAQGEAANPANGEQEDLLPLARRLLALSGGRLEHFSAEGQVFAVRAVMQTAEQVSVLFIDDNEDSLRLFQRYLEGSRFQFSAERDPYRALEAAEECGARIIVLDIMMPDIDGWELLGRIRAHPRLDSVPVIISTILPHEQLAESLGAAGFLRKPVEREALLAALDGLNE